MIQYALKRILYLIPVFIGVTFFTFLIFLVVPGDPVRLALGQHPNPELQQKIEHELGMDLPWYIRYFRYIGKAVQGDLGTSIRTGEPVTKIILDRFPATLTLTVAAMVFAIIVGLPAGIVSATKQYSLVDNTFMVMALVGISMPVFVLGLILLLIFVSFLHIVPGTGYGDGQLIYMLLPAITLGTIPMAIISRMTRSSLLEVMGSDYIRTARAKGIKEKSVVLKHAFKNAFIPVVTVIGNNFASLMAGAIITERVFNWPGIGSATISAIEQRDLPVVMGLVFFIAIIFVIVNLIVDISYIFIDPRIKLE
ncbi:MAG TPA: ABC transporter permease [Caldisericia bacterium]|jgi:peptide/nickel transport system permease protein|nr:MAG: Dipeptide transport system permease protein DppB [bacterium ADurb.Bin132]HNY61794.1 ABC transporter permease [Caldisericia bacterium]HOC79378.1 ABC transporter permease [Caldisericia bacterium]HOG70813.1 ABC transporter permease [Caldisericia bacterium]HPA66035.1 ABC transporter permease [Caldisericia bacterium]